MASNRLKGSVALLVLTMLYGVYGVYNRMIGSFFDPFAQQWIRNGLVAVIAVLIIILLRQKPFRIRREDIPWIAVWLLSGSWVMVALFIAFNHLYLSTVYFLFYSTMIISGVVCGSIFFREKMSVYKIASVLFSFIGLGLIYSLTVSQDDLVYVILSLGVGIALGFWNTISKKFSDHYSEVQIVFWDALAALTVGLIGFAVLGEAMPLFTWNVSWMWLIIYSLTQVATVGLLVYGFKQLEAQVGSLILPIEIIFATLFSYLVFGEVPSVMALVGGSSILVGALLPHFQAWIEYRQKIRK